MPAESMLQRALAQARRWQENLPLCDLLNRLNTKLLSEPASPIHNTLPLPEILGWKVSKDLVAIHKKTVNIYKVIEIAFSHRF